ncbi:MAG TPA: phosphopyruvate hydratase [Bryobacteraceae bacterium]|jgi:enolase|nr:phosphopyruvate hydratase [Bryobacteraceae bacterium]
MAIVSAVQGREILDSRGRPTIQAACVLSDGTAAAASVPSGASTGAAEAHELRDGDSARYRGLGCRKAAAAISGEICAALAGRDFASQDALDEVLIGLDGTPNKSRLGANSILAVSVAFARARAAAAGEPLYQAFARMLPAAPHVLPRLTINLFSGGKHAGGQVAIQDVLMIPLRTQSMDATLAAAHEIYEAAAELILARFGMRRLRADEGGLAPPANSTREMIELAAEAIAKAGFTPGVDVALGVDVASSHFFREGRYHLDGEVLDSAGMIDRLAQWTEAYPIVSVEDGLAEDDWDHWPALRERIQNRSIVLGDDLLCTNPARISRAIESAACNALLLKVNQIGTLTEAASAYRLARSAGWKIVLSVRSGETEDAWAADLAVGWGADQFKNGSITQAERTAKYNRLLEIETQTGWPVRPF